jgi:lipoprotein-releasing system permease protein
MNVSITIASRYVRSRKNRGFLSFVTAIAIGGVALGVATLIITLSILRGFERSIKESAVSFTAHMQLFGFSNQPLQNPEAALRRVRERFPQVRSMAPYVAREALIRSSKDIDGILLKGVDPEVDISPAGTYLREGHYDLAERERGPQGIILGRRLAEKLEVRPGDRVFVFALPGLAVAISQSRVRQFEVVGLYETGMAEYDASYAFVHLKSAQQLFEFGRAISGYDILVDDLDALPTLVEELPADLGYPYYARTMYQMYRNLFTWIELQKKPIPIILGLIIIVATVNVIGTLLMMVMERAKDVGILRSLGADARTIRRIFLAQGMFIGLLGTACGNLLAYALCRAELHYQFISLPPDIYFMSHVPIDLWIWNFILVSFVTLVLTYVCSLLPARVATRLDPVRLLRFA